MLDYEGKGIKVSLLPNPSHLGTSYPSKNTLHLFIDSFPLPEAVNPVALGKARAKQYSLLKALEKGGAGAEGCMLGDKVRYYVSIGMHIS